MNIKSPSLFFLLALHATLALSYGYDAPKALSTYGESDVLAVRWPDGEIPIYDATNFSDLDRVVAALNSEIGATAKLVVTREAINAKINIISGKLPEGQCGSTVTSTQSRVLVRADIIISDDITSGACAGNSRGLNLYFHEMVHAVGLSRHTRYTGSVMDHAPVMNLDAKLPTAYRLSLRALYALPPGSIIPDRMDITPPPDIDMASLIKGKSSKPIFSAESQKIGQAAVNDIQNSRGLVRISLPMTARSFGVPKPVRHGKRKTETVSLF